MNISVYRKYMSRVFLRITLIIMAVVPFVATAQLSAGGKPLMPDLSGFPQVRQLIELPPPDVTGLERQDKLAEGSGLPERMGVFVPVLLDSGSGVLVEANTGSEVTRVFNIRSKGAKGLGLYFSKFRLPDGARLFVYSEDRTHVLGAYTSANNHPGGNFAIEVTKGESIFVEYTCQASEADEPAFEIDEVLYVYKPMRFPGDRSAAELYSGSCEVNTACSEGDNWRNQIKSVVRILVKKGSSSFWCTGTVMNNTASDYSPLVLTADHCAGTEPGPYATPGDLSKWIFYFNYETPGCENETVEDDKSLTGAVKLASSSPLGNDGSDFYLLMLNDFIPAAYEPYYAGWSNSGEISPSGVGIHHPAGDVKKISTYTQPLSVNQWGQVPGTHYRVVWSETENGHGVTEGGSSGSPIFDHQGRVIGQLTGGESGCTNLTGPDFYGRISYSWESNGQEDSLQLKPWLDPSNTGLTTLNGSFNENRVIARFKADTTIVPVGSTILFNDLSTGTPFSWHWEFEGGEPAESESQSPEAIRYNETGLFNVKLLVTNQAGADSLIRENYIRVVPLMFPNPAFDEVNVMLGNRYTGEITLTILNSLGREVFGASNWCAGETYCKLDLSGLSSGFYYLRLKGSDFTETTKLLIIRN
ncbi:MAG: T9SS type A sorting domain-containing protein [Lentimicrobium sp.]